MDAGKIATIELNMDSKEKNNYIYILKALAIFSVICAHATPLAEVSRGAQNVTELRAKRN